MGLSKRVHTTELMASLNINKIYDIVKRNGVSLLKRIFKVQSPLKRLTIHMLSQFISKGTIVPGTIVSNILSMGLSPVQCAFNDFKFHLPNSIHDNGHIDSIRAMIFHEKCYQTIFRRTYIGLFINQIFLISHYYLVLCFT